MIIILNNFVKNGTDKDEQHYWSTYCFTHTMKRFKKFIESCIIWAKIFRFPLVHFLYLEILGGNIENDCWDKRSNVEYQH